jgi:hypothetical protein
MKKIHSSPLISLLLVIPVLISAQKTEVDFGWSNNQSNQVTRGLPVVLNLHVLSTLGFTRNAILHNIPDSLQQDSAILHRLDSIYAPIRFAGWDRLWYESIVFVVETDGGKKKPQFNPVIIKPYPRNEYGLEPGKTLRISYGIDPEITKRWNEGKVKIKAGIRMAGDTDTVWTGTLVLDIGKRVVKGIETMSERELYLVGNYWMLRNECLKAKPFAEKIHQMDPGQFGHITLLAEVYECLGMKGIALRLYIDAFRKHSKTPSELHIEPPIMLMEKIRQLQNELMGTQDDDDDDDDDEIEEVDFDGDE